MAHASGRKKKLFFIAYLFATMVCTLHAHQEEVQPNHSVVRQELDFAAQPDFSDELDAMLDKCDGDAFNIKEPSRFVVFLRSVADPVVYYMMKIYNHTREQIRHIRVKVLALLAISKRA